MTINSKIQIPYSELVFKASRSSGPGGQNINKLNTKVAVIFDIKNSNVFGSQQKQIIIKKLAGRLTKDEKLIITSQSFRTQKANRNAAIKRLFEVIRKAMEKPKPRKPTKPTLAAVEKRIKHKKSRSLLKQQRRKVEL
ncbi:MAG: hypothetical protein A2173_09800 [Planctomycetes bacterium RBG_13_44_8b]|nr:MAG: hypothetical protein A2173_09800 [Planctomycetes bacterium RBG_13_44_8b]